MSRSFRGRPDPEDDKRSKQVSGSRPPSSQDAAPKPPGFNFNSLHKYGDDEQLAVEPVQVDVGKRLVAGLIDVLAGFVIGMAVNCIPFVNVYIHEQLALIAFLMVRDALFNGRGVGKNLMGLQVVDIKTGQAATLKQSIMRNVVVFGPYVTLYGVNIVLKFMPNEVNSVVTNIVTGVGTVYTLAVIPYEAWRAFSRVDGLRWGDQFAGTATVPADMDFSNPLPK